MLETLPGAVFGSGLLSLLIFGPAVLLLIAAGFWIARRGAIFGWVALGTASSARSGMVSSAAQRGSSTT